MYCMQSNLELLYVMVHIISEVFPDFNCVPNNWKCSAFLFIYL